MKIFTQSNDHLQGLLPEMEIQYDSIELRQINIDYAKDEATGIVLIKHGVNETELPYTIDISDASGSYASALTSIRNRVKDQLKLINELSEIV